MPPPIETRTLPVGMPQDAGPHDSVSAIEWWYFNAFLTTSKGHEYAIVAAFFRTGLSPTLKGHYLVYSLTDLKSKTQDPYGLIDHTEIDLLKTFAGLQAAAHPDDPRPLQTLALLQRGELPSPIRVASGATLITTAPEFSATLDNATIAQASPDGLSWKASLNGDDWTLDLTMEQPANQPPMRVGGTGKTGLKRPEDMYYLSLTRMQATGSLTYGGVVDRVTGSAWVDRQWGTSWGIQNNGWDWFGLHLGDGSDLIVYRIKDVQTGKILSADATLLNKEGVQQVETDPIIAPTASASPNDAKPEALTFGGLIPPVPGAPAAAPAPPTAQPDYLDPQTHISFPQSWTIRLPKLGITLFTQSVFPEQTLPVVGVGSTIWEGVVSATGVRDGKAITGRGYMELVGYQPSPTVAPAPAAPR